MHLQRVPAVLNPALPALPPRPERHPHQHGQDHGADLDLIEIADLQVEDDVDRRLGDQERGGIDGKASQLLAHAANAPVGAGLTALAFMNGR
jgi:hypothetical protein